MRIVDCKYCGKRFLTDHSTKTFCDINCKRSYENKQSRKYPISSERKERRCLECDKEFNPLSFNKPNQKFCSIRCRNNYNQRLFYKNNKDFILEENKKSRKINKEYHKQKDKIYYQKNRERLIQRKLNYRKTVIGRKIYYNSARLYSIRRRYMIGENKLSTKDILFIEQRDNYECVYCHKKDRLTLDHIVPFIKNGKDEIDNVVLACINCNASKKGMDVEIWCKEKNIEIPMIVIELLKKINFKKRFIKK